MNNIKSFSEYKEERIRQEMFNITLKVFQKTLASQIKSVKPSDEFDNKIILPKHWFKNKNII
jgi:hypothetical protein